LLGGAPGSWIDCRVVQDPRRLPNRAPVWLSLDSRYPMRSKSVRPKKRSPPLHSHNPPTPHPQHRHQPTNHPPTHQDHDHGHQAEEVSHCARQLPPLPAGELLTLQRLAHQPTRHAHVHRQQLRTRLSGTTTAATRAMFVRKLSGSEEEQVIAAGNRVVQRSSCRRQQTQLQSLLQSTTNTVECMNKGRGLIAILGRLNSLSACIHAHTPLPME